VSNRRGEKSDSALLTSVDDRAFNVSRLGEWMFLPSLLKRLSKKIQKNGETSKGFFHPTEKIGSLRLKPHGPDRGEPGKLDCRDSRGALRQRQHKYPANRHPQIAGGTRDKAAEAPAEKTG
jgi:hypothetical protein